MNKLKSSDPFIEPCGTPACKFILDLNSLYSVLQVNLILVLRTHIPLKNITVKIFSYFVNVICIRGCQRFKI